MYNLPLLTKERQQMKLKHQSSRLKKSSTSGDETLANTRTTANGKRSQPTNHIYGPYAMSWEQSEREETWKKLARV